MDYSNIYIYIYIYIWSPINMLILRNVYGIEFITLHNNKWILYISGSSSCEDICERIPYQWRLTAQAGKQRHIFCMVCTCQLNNPFWNISLLVLGLCLSMSLCFAAKKITFLLVNIPTFAAEQFPFLLVNSSFWWSNHNFCWLEFQNSFHFYDQITIFDDRITIRGRPPACCSWNPTNQLEPLHLSWKKHQEIPSHFPCLYLFKHLNHRSRPQTASDALRARGSRRGFGTLAPRGQTS